jgi:hypothetical protein
VLGSSAYTVRSQFHGYGALGSLYGQVDEGDALTLELEDHGAQMPGHACFVHTKYHCAAATDSKFLTCFSVTGMP